jgi:transcriptional regulator with XRE-family HTH domain
MRRKIHLPIPVQKSLRKMGKNISDARRRRRITMELMAERAGFSRITLTKIEKGEPSVSMGAYASALFVLGLTDHLGQLADASHDIVGREIEEENLPKRVRLPKNALEDHDE